jgi:hypothetical protein
MSIKIKKGKKEKVPLSLLLAMEKTPLPAAVAALAQTINGIYGPAWLAADPAEYAVAKTLYDALLLRAAEEYNQRQEAPDKREEGAPEPKKDERPSEMKKQEEPKKVAPDESNKENAIQGDAPNGANDETSPEEEDEDDYGFPMRRLFDGASDDLIDILKDALQIAEEDDILPKEDEQGEEMRVQPGPREKEDDAKPGAKHDEPEAFYSDAETSDQEGEAAPGAGRDEPDEAFYSDAEPGDEEGEQEEALYSDAQPSDDEGEAAPGAKSDEQEEAFYSDAELSDEEGEANEENLEPTIGIRPAVDRLVKQLRDAASKMVRRARAKETASPGAKHDEPEAFYSDAELSDEEGEANEENLEPTIGIRPAVDRLVKQLRDAASKMVRRARTLFPGDDDPNKKEGDDEEDFFDVPQDERHEDYQDPPFWIDDGGLRVNRRADLMQHRRSPRTVAELEEQFSAKPALFDMVKDRYEDFLDYLHRAPPPTSDEAEEQARVLQAARILNTDSSPFLHVNWESHVRLAAKDGPASPRAIEAYVILMGMPQQPPEPRLLEPLLSAELLDIVAAGRHARLIEQWQQLLERDVTRRARKQIYLAFARNAADASTDETTALRWAVAYKLYRRGFAEVTNQPEFAIYWTSLLQVERFKKKDDENTLHRWVRGELIEDDAVAFLRSFSYGEGAHATV